MASTTFTTIKSSDKDTAFDETKEIPYNIATTLLFIIIGMLFMTLFMSYTVIRSQQQIWPPMGAVKASLFYPILSSFFILFSSLFLIRYQRKLQNGFKSFDIRFSFWSAFVCGGGFIVSQTLLWNHLKLQGLFVSSGTYGSFLHALTWVHAAHMVSGLLALLFIRPPIRSANKEKSLDLIRVRGIGRYWHFLAIIWAVMFVILFII